MQKKCVFALVFLLMCTSLFSVDKSIFYELGIIPIHWQSLTIGTDDLISFQDVGGGEIYSGVEQLLLEIEGDGRYSVYKQDLNWEFYITNYTDISLAIDFVDAAGPNGGMDNGLFVSFDRYFSGLFPIPLGIIADSSLAAGFIIDNAGYSSTHLELDWTAGIGVGRKVPVRSVAVILAAAEELGIAASDQQVLDAARVYARSAEYFYKFRERRNEEFYGDIAAILGVKDSMSVRRAVLNTNAVSGRFIGPSVRITYSQGFDMDVGELSSPEFSLAAEVGMPIGMTRYLEPSLFASGYRSDITDEIIANVGLGVLFATDFTRNWSFSATGIVYANQDTDIFATIGFNSDVYILNRLYLDFDYVYQITPDPTTHDFDVNISLNFTAF